MVIGVRSSIGGRTSYAAKFGMVAMASAMSFLLPSGQARPLLARKIPVTAITKSITASKEAQELRQIQSLVSELNTLIPSNPVQKAKIVNKWAYYDQKKHEILVTLGPHAPEVTAHEMGHAIFRVLLGGAVGTKEALDAVKDPLFQKIYYLSQGNDNYKIIKDSTYCKGDPRIGHPWDNASELFASALMVYRLHADEFIARITDPKTSPEARRLGKLIHLYFRDGIYNRIDGIFNRKYFPRFDPFAQESLEDIEISDEEIFTAVVCSNLDNMLVINDRQFVTIIPDKVDLAFAADKDTKYLSVRATIKTLFQRGFVSTSLEGVTEAGHNPFINLNIPPTPAFVTYCYSR